MSEEKKNPETQAEQAPEQTPETRPETPETQPAKAHGKEKNEKNEKALGQAGGKDLPAGGGGRPKDGDLYARAGGIR